MKIIYEAFFITNPGELERLFPQVHVNKFYHHSTISFRPTELSEPNRLGEDVLLKVVGRFKTARFDALVVETPFGWTFFPHITLSTAECVEPKEVKTTYRNGFQDDVKIELFDSPVLVEAKYGFYDGKEEVFAIEKNEIVKASSDA